MIKTLTHNLHLIRYICFLLYLCIIAYQVAETPQEIPFLSILQHLLRIDPKEAVSDIIWDTAERLVHRATLLENRDDAARLLRAPSVQSKLFCHCQHRSESNPSSRKQSLNAMPLSPPPGPPPPQPLGKLISSILLQNGTFENSISTRMYIPIIFVFSYEYRARCEKRYETYAMFH